MIDVGQGRRDLFPMEGVKIPEAARQQALCVLPIRRKKLSPAVCQD